MLDFPRFKKQTQLKACRTRELKSSSTRERKQSSSEENGSESESSRADSDTSRSSHLHFTRRRSGSVTLRAFTASEIEVTNRERFLSGMAALINGHEQLGREKRTVLQGPPVQPRVSRHDMLPTVEILARTHLLGVYLALSEGALVFESVYFTGNFI